MQRRLATILVADVVGYSRLMEAAEETTAAGLKICHQVMSEAVAAAEGRVFNRAGDAMLAEFASPINALRCAVQIRENMAAEDAASTARLQLRFGLHLADVMVTGDDLIGDGVNLTARIQQTAEPDAINVSQPLFDQIKRHSPYSFDDLGERSFKNLSQPMRIYRLRGHIGNHRLQSAPTQPENAKAQRVLPNSIAVLPFSSLGGDKQQTYLAEGLAEEIIVELARFKKLHVASRSASFAFSRTGIEPTRVADTLGVKYVLEGQVQRHDNNLRLALHLVNGETGIEVWADRLTRRFENVFDLMDEVIAKVAATILGRVEADAIELARRKPPTNMTAYDYMLRGLDYHRLGCITTENSRKAVHWFDKAIEADPNYGPAYAWRICAASWLPEFNINADAHYIERALELDPNNPEAQRIMGVIQMFKGNFDAARYHHQRAMELSPSDAYILARCASFYSYNGQPDIALQVLKKATDLDPLLPVWCVEEKGIAHFALGEFEKSLAALSELPFQSSRSRTYQCAALMALGRQDDARIAIKQAMATNSELTTTYLMRKELWREPKIRKQISDSLVEAGLPS
jgi:class 3 adenylate cyclase/TolB-like protein/Flp pilus assembly protein TadD